MLGKTLKAQLQNLHLGLVSNRRNRVHAMARHELNLSLMLRASLRSTTLAQSVSEARVAHRGSHADHHVHLQSRRWTLPTSGHGGRFVVATQRLTVVTIAGQSAATVAIQFNRWLSNPDPTAIDQFCVVIQGHDSSLPIVFFVQWVDRWLMGDLLPDADTVNGERFQAACMSVARAIEFAGGCGEQWVEQKLLASQIREATYGWGTVTDKYVIVLIRERLGPSTLDDEAFASLETVPDWLFPAEKTTEPGE